MESSIVKIFMRLIIIFLLALAVAGFSKFNTGSVTINLFEYQIQLSLNLLIILWLITFGIVYYGMRFIINLNRLPNKIKRARTNRALILSRRHLNAAGLNYFEGRFKSCYESAAKSIKHETSLDNKFLAYMLAFRSASMLRDSAKENKISTEISEFSEPKWQLAKHMIIAENLYNEQQYGQAIDNLQTVLQLDFKHIPARRMLLKVYLNLGNYHKAYEVLEWLLKNDSLREYKAIRYKARVIGGLFNETNDADELVRLYRRLDRKEQTSFLYGKLYFEALIRIKDYELALDFLVEHGKDESLQLIYREAILALAKKIDSTSATDRLLSVAEKCLPANRNSSELLLALGILSYRKQLWGKARSYLESSINLKTSLDGLIYLSFVAEATQDNQLLSEAQHNLLTNIQSFK